MIAVMPTSALPQERRHRRRHHQHPHAHLHTRCRRTRRRHRRAPRPSLPADGPGHRAGTATTGLTSHNIIPPRPDQHQRPSGRNHARTPQNSPSQTAQASARPTTSTPITQRDSRPGQRRQHTSIGTTGSYEILASAPEFTLATLPSTERQWARVWIYGGSGWMLSLVWAQVLSPLLLDDHE
jgi:hypothetical protein